MKDGSGRQSLISARARRSSLPATTLHRVFSLLADSRVDILQARTRAAELCCSLSHLCNTVRSSAGGLQDRPYCGREFDADVHRAFSDLCPELVSLWKAYWRERTYTILSAKNITEEPSRIQTRSVIIGAKVTKSWAEIGGYI